MLGDHHIKISVAVEVRHGDTAGGERLGPGAGFGPVATREATHWGFSNIIAEPTEIPACFEFVDVRLGQALAGKKFELAVQIKIARRHAELGGQM